MRTVPLLLVLCSCHPPAPTRAPAPAPAPGADPAPPRLRLPEGVRPLGYDVVLKLLPEEEQFEGEVAVELELKAATSFLWMHGAGLTVAEARLQSGSKELGARPVPVPAEGLLGFALSASAAPGRALLRVRYHGPLSRRDNDGLFRQEERGDWYAYSDFEPTDARRAFPCFDEPAFKVPWQLSLRVRRDHLALSNTPVESEVEEPGGLKRVRFRRTAPLPSYLVALAVGPFEAVDAGVAGQRRTPLRIIAPRGRGAEARYAAETSRHLLERLEGYFGIPYPYEKLDQIAVLKFSGAMENPGLITYAQGLLLSRPEEETAGGRRRYASIAAHEMAHQWFGNYVTMRYWDDVWLNESFASWMGDRIIAEWQPGWDVPAQRARSRGHAMAEDSLLSARAVRQPIGSSHDIHNAFDSITYQKGQAVLEMFEGWIGPGRFRDGVRRYLRDHAFGSAAAADFLQVLAAEGGEEVAAAMRSFIDQPGVPLVSVSPVCAGGQAPVLRLRQQRYLPAGSAAEDKTLWQVPVCARYGKDGRACALLTSTEGELPLPGLRACSDLIVPNAGAAGYYRVRCSEGLAARLLRDGGAALTVPERIAVLDDLGALLDSGDLPADEAISLGLRAARDRNRHVLQEVMELLLRLRPHLVPKELRPAYARLLRTTFGARARALGLRLRPGDDEETILLRGSLVGIVGGPGEDLALRAEARRLVEGWLKDRKLLGPEEVDLVLRVAAYDGDVALFERLHEAARAARTHHERTRLIGAMAAFRNLAVVRRALDLVLSGSFDVRDSIRLLFGPRDEEEAAELSYRYVKEHFDELVARLPQSSGARLISAGAAFCDEAHRADVEAFFRERAARLPGGPRELEQVLEQVRLCAARKAAQQERVAALLRHPGS